MNYHKNGEQDACSGREGALNVSQQTQAYSDGVDFL